MTANRDRVYAILDDVNNDTDKAIPKVRLDGELVNYVLRIGLDHIKATRRHKRRQELTNTVVRKEFVRGSVTGSIKLSKAYVGKLKKVADTLFQDWSIGGVRLGDATKEQLRTWAADLRASAKGSLRNALFYDKLADPMKDGQTVSSYWKSPQAVKIIRDELWEETETKTVAFK
jgi:hypothetical protein